MVEAMSAIANKEIESHLNARLATGGFRFTPQREHVYGVLLEERDHPTAEQVFLRAKKAMPDISMATVYNCLDALVHSAWSSRSTWIAARAGSVRTCTSIAIFTAISAAEFMTLI